ncbi:MULTISPECIES: TonB-dependent receptor [Alteromonas]|uniref:TonB-dependent receptor family protein n=3 Tax=root TaxID=1 RepID=A0AB36FPA9_ALTMA|nr:MULTISPECIES: TonB-dependent receptor [Alteromonas]MCP3704771.1 TonB-dependent receptor [Alteromonas sp.]AFS39208.1 TonB-dependent receptor [Alteromonas macleodii ATCC 27126]AFT76393.1 TonB-dependent receptor [Alteromonas macleodii str. 'English Channel 673']MBL3810484.1 TonB-dependent receptor [Alteromonas macleodii]MBL3884021.1 TonB-dependent receptor [Alteromonas macleodii]|tara:strand:+ start:8327 stop:11233 length:2907 start_codon:yes stop_codon:yes gene_type:complete
MYRKTKLACSVAAVLASAISANSAFAQDAQPNKDVEVIEVSGIRSSVAKSMDVKRSSAGVVDAISAEDIGDFPDTNLAESLQRITGVSIDRSGGEGQLITVRGFGPQFNTVLVNGRQMASENDSRAFSFDTIASELVSSLDVHKTSTATMQSGGVGSTININTARPFALNGFKMAGSVKGVYDENSEETTPQFSGLISNTFNDDTFGVLLAVSHQERETRLNQAQMDGWLENVGVPNPVTQSGDAWTGNVFSPRNYDHKVTFEERTRTNANLVFQYAPNDKLVVTADALYSDFDVESEATSYGHWFTAPNIQGVGDDGSLFDENGNRRSPTVDANGTIVDLYQEVGLATDMHAKTFDRLTDTYAIGLNFDYQYSDNLNLSFDLSHSEAEREANNGGGDQLSLIGYANRVRFQVDDNILPVASMFASPNDNIYSGQQELDGAIVTGPDGFPIYNPALTPDGVSNHLDEANSRAHVMLRRGWAVEDEVSQLRFDGEYVTDGSGLTEIRFGAQYSTETKSLTRWDNEGVGIHCTYCGYPDLPEIPAGSQYVFDAGSDFLSDVSGSGRMPTSWLAHDGEANFAFLESYYQSVNGDSISFDAVRRNNSFEVEEDIISTYMEFDFEGEVADMFLSATAGVRYEMTDVTVNGTQAPITGLTILDQTEMLAGFGDAQSIATESDYDVLLPNFSVRLEITDDLIARFAASSTITRPTLNSMSPVTVITTTRQGGDLTSTSGNPALEPFKSDNLDLSLEYYYDEASYASIGYFRKLVSNFIVNSQEDKTFELADGSLLTDPSTGTNASAPDAGDDVAVFTNTLPNNGEDATVDGFELALQHTFDNGFGVLANGTIVDSDAELDPFDINQVFALTGLSDSYNLVAFYETDDYQIRLAYNWRDEFVQSLTQGQGDGPTIVESYQQLDISGSYSVTDNVEIFFEGINLTEEFVHKRGRFSNHLLLVEDSGRRWAFGVRGNF